jgi:hypothetical protein
MEAGTSNFYCKKVFENREKMKLKKNEFFPFFVILFKVGKGFDFMT